MLVDNLSHSFADTVALDGVGFAVDRHARIGVVGPSGCGKSTLLQILGGLLEQSSGRVEIDGWTAAPERLKRCALMPQRDLLLPWRDAIGNACLALENRGVRGSEARRQALPHFERFGLAEFTAARPWELSGGMRQRVAFLRTLLAGKDVLLLDEPFGSLDSITRAQMQEWLNGALAAEPRTVVLVTHDVEEAIYLCDLVLVLSPRPGRVTATLATGLPSAPSRRELVTSPEFTALKHRALEALESR